MKIPDGSVRQSGGASPTPMGTCCKKCRSVENSVPCTGTVSFCVCHTPTPNTGTEECRAIQVTDWTSKCGLTHYYRLRHPEGPETQSEMVIADEVNREIDVLLATQKSQIIAEVESLRKDDDGTHKDDSPYEYCGCEVRDFNAALDALSAKLKEV